MTVAQSITAGCLIDCGRLNDAIADARATGWDAVADGLEAADPTTTA